MSRTRASSLAVGFVAILVMSFVAAWAAEGAKSTPPTAFQAEFKAILTEGFKSTTSLDQLHQDLKARVKRARALNAKDPSIDYSYGLILMKRLQHEQAAESFLTALKIDPTYLPASKALARLRLNRQDTKTLLSEANDFAAAIGGQNAKWENEQQREASATFLGRVMGYLGKPEIKLVNAETLQSTEEKIEGSLGSDYVDAYLAGMESLSKDYDALKQEFEEKTAKKSEEERKQASEKAIEFQKKSKDAEQQAETLKLSKEEIKAKFDEQVKQIDKNLADLEKQYDNYRDSAERCEELIQKTRLDLARAQTELDLRGANNAELRPQPSIVMLQEELARYLDKFDEAEQNGEETLAAGRQLVQERLEAAANYERETGELAQSSKELDKWNKSMKKNADKLQNPRKKRPVNAAQLKAKLASSDSYFRIDYDAEIDRLLKVHGLPPLPAKKTSKANLPKSKPEAKTKVGS